MREGEESALEGFRGKKVVCVSSDRKSTQTTLCRFEPSSTSIHLSQSPPVGLEGSRSNPGDIPTRNEQATSSSEGDVDSGRNESSNSPQTFPFSPPLYPSDLGRPRITILSTLSSFGSVRVGGCSLRRRRGGRRTSKGGGAGWNRKRRRKSTRKEVSKRVYSGF